MCAMAALSGNCRSCRRIVVKGLVCNNCNFCFHWKCIDIDPDNFVDKGSWECSDCIYDRKMRDQLERIRALELELDEAKCEINKLRALKDSISVSNKGRSHTWMKPKNSKSRSRRFSADDAASIKLTNKFSALQAMNVDQENSDPVSTLVKVSQKTDKVNDCRSKVLILGSSHARGISSLLKSKLGDEFEVSSVCKPNAPLKNVVEDMMKLSSEFSKRDHVVIVGGPGNSIDNDCNYSIEKDVNNIIEMSSHTNVGFLSLFSRYDKPYLHRRVRSVNMRLERALMRPGASHIGLIDVSPIRRYEYTSHGLHLNGRGKEHLSVLIANSIRGSHVKKQSCNIPVLVNARASPFLG